jgi:ketosteroid isomerase-like protein
VWQHTGERIAHPYADRTAESNEERNIMTMSNAREVIDRYFTALKQKDFATMRTLLHDDVSFRGALGTTATAEEYIKGIEQITASMASVERRVVVAEGEDVFQVYDLVLATPAVTLPIAQWLKVRDNRIATVQVFFDPRPLVQPSAS